MAQTVGVIAAVASMAALAAQPTWRGGLLATLARWTGYHAPGGLWRIAAILLALVNLKNLPFVWHIRIFRALIYQLYVQPTPIPPHALFQPVITSSRTTLLETDYNLHKSNSTYFSDMDISRSALFSAIMRNAIRKSPKASAAGATQGTKGTHMIALGGISCLFKKEILPYKKYEMWTRLLCWDRKWFYLITHLVKPGVARPKAWTLQPWRKASARSSAEGVDKEKLKGAVFATGIAKYVIKRGRLTIPPEQALVDAGMVPLKPEGWVYEGGDVKEDAEAIEESTLPREINPEEWNWDVIEKERRRGLVVAEKFAGLEGMHGYFDGGEGGVLGEYADLLW
ncbi:hypothetical protein yc1106_08105 [Curvularia clavata]|uniref:Capsule polysaccharide biosynthesis protein n=1 Tax=Curvularia clavata TaxID=95742 RepID=A0A9Q8ZCR4_CURCL|nr:hypothetical protein yc1106_08105 [Curvularia clavata]